MVKQKILIIEDNPAIKDLLRNRFEVENYEVMTAADGEAGFSEFIDKNPDLVILDLNLPKISGYEVCRRIRRDKEDKTPILMLTSKSGDTNRIIGRVKGADCYMAKPFDAEELMREVKNLLD